MADVVARLLLDPVVEGTVAVGHSPGLVGPELADALSAHWGHEVAYESIAPETFGDLIAPILGPAGRAVVGLYQALNAQGSDVIAEHSSAQRVLGLSPRPISQWLVEMGV